MLEKKYSNKIDVITESVIKVCVGLLLGMVLTSILMYGFNTDTDKIDRELSYDTGKSETKINKKNTKPKKQVKEKEETFPKVKYTANEVIYLFERQDDTRFIRLKDALKNKGILIDSINNLVYYLENNKVVSKSVSKFNSTKYNPRKIYNIYQERDTVIMSVSTKKDYGIEMDMVYIPSMKEVKKRG